MKPNPKKPNMKKIKEIIKDYYDDLYDELYEYEEPAQNNSVFDAIEKCDYFECCEFYYFSFPDYFSEYPCDIFLDDYYDIFDLEKKTPSKPVKNGKSKNPKEKDPRANRGKVSNARLNFRRRVFA